MRAINPAKGLDQIEDRLLLPTEQPVHRAAGIAVLERARLPQPCPPAVRADVSEVEHPARPRVRPPSATAASISPGSSSLVSALTHAGDRAEKPKRCLPRNNVNSTAISFSASDSLSFSARNRSVPRTASQD
jgi:hypothetical protein